MSRVATGVLMLLATSAVLSAAQPPEPAEQTLPATDINRESNNPAKAAIKAKQAQDKEKAQQEIAAEEAPVPTPLVVSDRAQLMQRVEAALGNDIRTAKLGVTVKPEGDVLIGLHGTVRSSASRDAVLDVATKVASAVRIKSHLVVTGK